MVTKALNFPEAMIRVEVWALVPARSGSKGIIDKNLQEVQGVSLLGLSVLAGISIPEVDRCFVSTDSASYAEEGRRFGAEVPFLRPSSVSNDSSTDLDVFLHFMTWAVSQCGYLPWSILHLRPTTPCREPDRLVEVLELSRGVRDSATCIRSVHSAPESPFKWFLKDDAGFLTTFGGERELDESNRSRAEFEEVFIPNGYADVVYTSHLIRTGLLHGDAVRPFETEPVIEVDGPFELELLRRAGSVPRALLESATKVLANSGSAREMDTSSK